MATKSGVRCLKSRVTGVVQAWSHILAKREDHYEVVSPDDHTRVYPDEPAPIQAVEEERLIADPNSVTMLQKGETYIPDGTSTPVSPTSLADQLPALTELTLHELRAIGKERYDLAFTRGTTKDGMIDAIRSEMAKG